MISGQWSPGRRDNQLAALSGQGSARRNLDIKADLRHDGCLGDHGGDPVEGEALMATERILVLGTGNVKKGIELADLLAPYGLILKTLADFDDPLEVVEDGDSFAANAALKATQQARHLGHWTLGEDSGISVAALDGEPGIYSARFSGEGATDESNNQHLIEKLGQTPLEKRQAHYTCHMALSDPHGDVRESVECHCHGRIRFEAAGTAGFGYDPYFEVPEYHKTFGQLGDKVKSILSHRARAMRQLVPRLHRLILDGHWS